MRTRLLCAAGFLFALLPVGSQAQGTCVSGYVVNAQSQEPLRFAAVQLQRDGAGAVADEHGYFELESTAPWDHDSLVVLHDAVRSALRVDHTRSQGLRLAVAVPSVAVSPVLPARPGPGNHPCPKDDAPTARFGRAVRTARLFGKKRHPYAPGHPAHGLALHRQRRTALPYGI